MAKLKNMKEDGLRDILVYHFLTEIERGKEVDEKLPEISAFISTWDKYEDEVNDLPLSAFDRKIMRQLINLLLLKTKLQPIK